MRSIIIQKIAVLVVGVFISQIGIASNGATFEKNIQKQTNNTETFKYTFESTQIDRDHFLSVVAKTKEISLISVKLNGKIVSNYAQPKFLKKHLLKKFVKIFQHC